MATTEQRKQILTLGVLIALISVLHYGTTTSKSYFHEIYKVLYYIPIILAAFRFGIRGGLAASLVISLIYAPHVIFQWQGDLDHNISRFLEIVLYNTVAYITGRLVEGEHRERQRYERAAAELSESYLKLQRQSETLAEVEEQLRRADRLAVMGELAASLAHEVRNPLGSIRGAVEILQDDYPEENPNYEFLMILIKEVDRLNQVIENYLSLARPKITSLNEFGLRDAVFSVVGILSPKARRDRIDLDCRLPNQPITIKGDENKFRQVLLNLLLNSMAAMENGGRIAIDTHVEEGHRPTLVLSISDTGKGIPEEQMEHIFKPFYTTRDGGTGLGLPITKRIADQYKWGLRLQSKPNEGTTAILRIPLEEENHETPENPADR